MKFRFIYKLLVVAGAQLWSAGSAMAACEPWVARLASFQGRVEGQSAGSAEWRKAEPEQAFCSGDKIRTLELSRASLQLSNQTYLSLDQKTTVVFSAVKPQAPSWLDLLKGVIYLRSRTPSALDIRAPFVNAAIKGTEFLVSSDEEKSQVTVFEGQVDAYNPRGRLNLTDGQTAFAKAGQAPARKLLLRPQDAVQWALYYPPLIDLSQLKDSASPSVRQAVSRYLAGDTAGALTALDAAKDDPAQILRAGLLLSVGRVNEAAPLLRELSAHEPVKGEAAALQSVIALAQDDRETAHRLADQAVSLKPGSPIPWTAQSYVQQASFDLKAALESARRAADRDPHNALAQTRLAELYASLGRRTEARQAAEKAITLSPRSARARTVLGFMQLMAMEVEEAERSFHDAIRLDSADPLARFGLGLAKIRQGRLDEGTADLEIAASLDPNDSLTRSYLGKAYYEQKRGKLAEKEYHLAEQFDSKDPTPWFYDAIKKRTENRPVEALHDMQESIELNDNRAVYRSRQMLDDDLAAREANLARTYDNLGFRDRARLEGWKSIAADPSNFSAHRFLSDSYSTFGDQRAARVSELLQSQLLQPANISPIPPELAQADLVVLPGAGPSDLSFNEFNPLFVRDGLALQANAVGGNRGTFGDDLILSGIKGQFSGSLGQFHYGTDGVRNNNDRANDIYNAFAQFALNPNFGVQGELRNSRQSIGDPLGNPFTIFTPQGFNPDLRQTISETSERFGLHYKPEPNQDLLASYQHIQMYTRTHVGDIVFPLQNIDSHNTDIQYLLKTDYVNPIIGLSYLNGNILEASTSPNRYASSYIYLPIVLGRSATMTFGLSGDHYQDGGLRKTRLNPKFGLLWSPNGRTTLRFAAFRSIKRQLWARQVLEPTQIAGFNQVFDDLNGTEATRYGFGVDHRFSKDVLTGFEFSWRNTTVPVTPFPPFIPSTAAHTDESAYRAYINWSINDNIAIAARYLYSNDENPRADLVGVKSLTTHQAPLSLNYYHDSGFFAKFSTTYVNQHASIDTFVYSFVSGSDQNAIHSSHNESFWIFDTSVGFRLPRRLGIVSIEGRNLLDERFQYLPNLIPDFEKVQPYIPGRMILGRVNLFFD